MNIISVLGSGDSIVFNFSAASQSFLFVCFFFVNAITREQLHLT